MEVKCLHHCDENVYKQATELLNEHWPRNPDSRMEDLKKSNDDFPVNLVLLKMNNEDGNEVIEVIAHSKLSKCDGVPEDETEPVPNCVFVESVIVPNRLRGQGIGKIIMNETEKFAREKGFTRLYLSTLDKEGFYEHLGFERSQPVTCLGNSSRFLDKNQLSGLLSVFGARAQPTLVNGKDNKGQTWFRKSIVNI